MFLYEAEHNRYHCRYRWGHLTASSTKQGGGDKIGVADNTPEAEVVAANKANKCEAIPLQEIMSKILDRTVQVVHMVDNESAIKMCKKGYSPALRHLPRQDGLSLARMKEQYFSDADNGLTMQFQPTAGMKADCFTKSFKSVAEWKVKLEQIRMFKGIDEVKNFIQHSAGASSRSGSSQVDKSSLGGAVLLGAPARPVQTVTSCTTVRQSAEPPV